MIFLDASIPGYRSFIQQSANLPGREFEIPNNGTLNDRRSSNIPNDRMEPFLTDDLSDVPRILTEHFEGEEEDDADPEWPWNANNPR